MKTFSFLKEAAAGDESVFIKLEKAAANVSAFMVLEAVAANVSVFMKAFS